MSNINTSRRQFLKRSGALSAAGTFGSSLFLNLSAAADAAAADGTGYKALVCIYLDGGNDACNTILPDYDDTESWARYNAVRGTLTQVKPTTKTSGPYAITGAKTYPLHPSLTNVSSMLNQSNSKLALVANVGNILGATTSTSGTFPPLLRSHNDQSTVWQDGKSNIASSGWGGRAVELTNISPNSTQANAFRAVVLGNNNVFCYGANATANVRPYGMVRNQGVIPLLPQQDGSARVFGGLQMSTILNVIQGKYTTFLRPRTNQLEVDYISLVTRAQDSQSYMANLLAQDPTANSTPLPTDEGGAPYALAQDLQIVAKVIAGQRLANATGRQVFFVSLRGFDIHTDGGAHKKLLRQVDQSLNYFRNALGGNLANVVAFTASEFGRLLHSNGDGCDHGWGGHQIVMGGPVVGGKIYGTVPHYKRNSGGTYTDAQMLGDGALVPAISLGSYAGSLLRWFGVSNTELTGVLDSAAMVGDSALSGMLA